MSNRLPANSKSGIVLGTRSASVEDEDKVTTEAIKENFPSHRTLHLIPNDDNIQTDDKVEIVVTEEVLFETTNHVGQDTSKESGGFLLGNRYQCPNTNRKYIIVDQFMKADYTEGTKVSLTFKTESWAQLKDKLDGKYRGKELIGWYHSHPGMGIFLSNYDLDIHKNRFAKEWQVALVLDPIKHEGGFFGWVDGTINPNEKLDFYELLETDKRETIVGWINYIAEDPKTGIPAMLSKVNTKNPSGEITTKTIDDSPPKTKISKNLLRNPYVVIGAASFALLLLLTTIAASYFWLFPKSDVTQSESTNEADTVIENKILKSESVRIGKELEGQLSSKGVMYLNVAINGIGDIEVIEQIRENNGVKIEINSQPAKITNTTINNGSILELQTETEISSETAEAFQDNKTENFKMLVEIAYNGDLVTRELKTTFKKGKGKKSLGYEIIFSKEGSQKDTTKKSKKKRVENKNVPKEPAKQVNKNSKKMKTTKSQKTNTKKTTDKTKKSSESENKSSNSGSSRPRILKDRSLLEKTKKELQKIEKKIKEKTNKQRGKNNQPPKRMKDDQ